MLPKDPMILLSYINTQLRDHYSDLDALCSGLDVDRKLIEDRLERVNYVYNEELNKFI